MSAHLSRRVLAELIGTALLVFFGAGSVVAAVIAGGGRLDYAALGFVGLAFGLVIAIVVYGFGTTSGAHINPAVSIALAAVRRFPWREVPAYIVAQLVGGVLGGVLIVAVFGSRATQIGGVGLTAVNPGVGYGQGMAAEAVGTFLLLLAIMALAVDRRAPPGPSGLVIGLAVATGIFVIGPLTGGSLNPARTFGPYVVNSIFGGVTPWRQFWVYVVGPIVGAVLAAAVYVAVARPVREVPAGAPQGTAGEVEGRRTPAGEVEGGRVAAGEAPAEAAQGTAGDIEGRRVDAPGDPDGAEDPDAPGDPDGAAEHPDGQRDERG